MSDNLVPVKKETGGCTLTYQGEEYEWKKDGDVVKVPVAWALELDAIHGGGFEIADEKAAAKAVEQAEAEAAPPDAPWGPAPVGDAPAPGVDERVVDGALSRPVEQVPGRPIARQAEKAKPRAGGRTQSKVGGQ